MKKGSKLRRCSRCGKDIGWIVPTGETVYGIPIAKFKKNRDYKFVKGKYVCSECLREDE